MTIYCDQQFRQMCVTSEKQKGEVQEFIPVSDWRQSYRKHVIKGHLYIQNKLSLWPTHPYSHFIQQKKNPTLPWSPVRFTVTSMQIRKTILHQHANHHTSVCVRDENKVSQWDEERKNYTSNFKKRNRHRRTAHVVLRENPMFDRRDLKLSPLFSIWILSDVTVDASTKKNTCTYTMCSVQRFISPWTKTKRERRVKAHPCLCL